MTYRVVLQRLAVADLRQAYDYAAERAPAAALRWLNRFEQALQSLEQFPERRSWAKERERVGIDVREFLFGKSPFVFRALFVIAGGVVRILRIRRAQRRNLSAAEMESAIAAGE